MKNWSKEIDVYTEAQFGLTLNQLFGGAAITGVLVSLLHVIQVVGTSLLSM